MKFKIGDKVRVREDLVEGNLYGTEYFIGLMEYYRGKVFEITKVWATSYKLGEDGLRWTDEMLEEVNEEVQEKTFREVIADIKEGEVWESVQSCFQLKEISCISGQINFKLEGVCIDRDNNNSICTGAGAGQTFKLQRKQYTFAEAFKAYEEGKEIESCYSGVTYKLQHGGSDCFGGGQKTSTIAFSEIRGKWYINN